MRSHRFALLSTTTLTDKGKEDHEGISDLLSLLYGYCDTAGL